MRLLSAALALALLAPAAHAQLVPSLNVGVAGGLNVSSFNEISNASLEGSTGYHVGLYADVSVPFVSVRTGVYYLSAGNVVRLTDRGGPSEEVLDADFVTIPLDLRIQTPTPVLKGYALVGPEVRFPLGTVAEGVPVDKRSANLAANVGLGVSFDPPLVGPNGFVEVRYSHDVTGFAADNGLATQNDYAVSLFQLRLGVGL